MTDRHLLESVVVLLYLAAVAVIGFFSARGGKGGRATDYFLAGRNLGWVAIGASVFVTAAWMALFAALSHPTLLEQGALPVCAGLAVVLLLFFAREFVPVFTRSAVFTVAEQWTDRYGTGAGLYLSVVSILFTVLVRIPLTIIAGSWIIQATLGWDFLSFSMLIIVVSGLYTVAGGLGAVVSTQVLQALVAIAGLSVLALGGGGLGVVLPGALSSDHTSMIGFLAAVVVTGSWFVGADQFTVQRVLGGRDCTQMRAGIFFAAALMGIILLLGLPITKSGAQAPLLVTAGSGLRSGLVGASFLALMMATLAGCYHSAATLFTLELYRRFRPSAADARLVLVGRLCTTGVVIFSILVASSTALVDVRIFAFLLELPEETLPPLGALALIGVFWKRISVRGAILCLVFGALLGVGLVAVRLAGVEPGSVFNANSIELPLLLFLAPSAVLVIVSLLSARGKRPHLGEVSSSAHSHAQQALGRSALR